MVPSAAGAAAGASAAGAGAAGKEQNNVKVLITPVINLLLNDKSDFS